MPVFLPESAYRGCRRDRYVIIGLIKAIFRLCCGWQTKMSKYLRKINLPLAFIALVIAIGVVYLVTQGFAAPETPREQPVNRFEEKRDRGLVWSGLRPAQAGSRCEGLLEMVDRNGIAQSCTHGPDPAPPGVDVRNSVEPLAAGTDSPPTAAAAPITCEGDGQTGSRVQVIYARAADKSDRYSQYAASFPQYAAAMNNIFVESSRQTGSLRPVRFVQDPVSCAPIVDRVTLSAAGDDSWSTTWSEIKALPQYAGRPDRHYLIWMDAGVYCGIGDLKNDNRPTADNASNGGGLIARVDAGCWGGSTEAHEVMHTLGGVQRVGPPHTTGVVSGSGGHCTDEYDRMCYADGSGLTMTYPCPSTDESKFDCNKDDYFNSSDSIPADNYLASFWNSANSVYLIRGQSVPLPAPDGTAPSVTISSPLNNAQVGSRVTIKAQATDDTNVTKMEVYIDGTLQASSSTASISTKWRTTKASRGFHTILVKAYDAANNVGQSSVTVIK